MKKWQMEYYNYKVGKVYFVVMAETFEEAQRIGDEMIRDLRRVGTYEKHD